MATAAKHAQRSHRSHKQGLPEKMFVARAKVKAESKA